MNEIVGPLGLRPGAWVSRDGAAGKVVAGVSNVPADAWLAYEVKWELGPEAVVGTTTVHSRRELVGGPAATATARALYELGNAHDADWSDDA